MVDPDRRSVLFRVGAGVGTLVLSGCDRVSQTQWVPDVLKRAQDLTLHVQRFFVGRNALAPEYAKADIAPVFRANGTLEPGGESYAAHLETGFKNWRIPVTGLVKRPLTLTVDGLRKMPSRTQITRHDCVEGWSCIGEWTGVPLQHILAMAQPESNARFAVFYCADNMSNDDGTPQFYYESLDMVEALHPQTILAYDLNGKPLPVANGAPVRLRAERQLGYKMAKYVNGIALVEDLSHVGGGNGGYWEDQGYTWWAGI